MRDIVGLKAQYPKKKKKNPKYTDSSVKLCFKKIQPTCSVPTPIYVSFLPSRFLFSL